MLKDRPSCIYLKRRGHIFDPYKTLLNYSNRYGDGATRFTAKFM